MERFDEASFLASVDSFDTREDDRGIAVSAQSCSRLFKESVTALQNARPNEQVFTSQLSEQQTRYELWARNIAAAQSVQLPTSLEHRLRGDRSARKIVQKGLDYVCESLEMGM